MDFTEIDSDDYTLGTLPYTKIQGHPIIDNNNRLFFLLGWVSSPDKLDLHYFRRDDFKHRKKARLIGLSRGTLYFEYFEQNYRGRSLKIVPDYRVHRPKISLAKTIL